MVYLPSRRLLSLHLLRAKVLENMYKSLNLVNWDYDFLQKLDPAACTAVTLSNMVARYQVTHLISFLKMFFHTLPSTHRSLPEFTWEKGVILSVAENANKKVWDLLPIRHTVQNMSYLCFLLTFTVGSFTKILHFPSSDMH